MTLSPDAYRADLARFHEELSREFYLHYSGQKDDLQLEAIYDKYAALATRETADELTSARDAADGDDVRRLGKLARYATDHFLDKQVTPLTAEISEAEARATVTVNGKSVPFHSLATAIRNEPDTQARRTLRDKRDEVTASLNPKHLERLRTLHRLAPELGYADYTQLYGALLGVDYKDLFFTMTAFLRDTEEVYGVALNRQAEERLGTPLSELEACDLAYMFRAPEYDALFPREKLVAAYEQTLAGLGIDLAAMPQVHVDMEERPKKHPRAFCAAVTIPHEVYLVIRPTGGQDDYQAFLHEGGHTQHFAWTQAEHPVEDLYIGDRATTEAYAFLFNYLPGDPLWMEDILGASGAEEFHRLYALQKLYMLRRYAGKLRYELALHFEDNAGREDEMAERYVHELTEATKVEYRPVNAFSDVDDGFYSADYLRAWMFEVQLRVYLKDNFGRRWWRSREAGEFLKDMWGTGNRYNVDELGRTLGVGALDIMPMQQECLDTLF